MFNGFDFELDRAVPVAAHQHLQPDVVMQLCIQAQPAVNEWFNGGNIGLSWHVPAVTESTDHAVIKFRQFVLHSRCFDKQ